VGDENGGEGRDEKRAKFLVEEITTKPRHSATLTWRPSNSVNRNYNQTAAQRHPHLAPK